MTIVPEITSVDGVARHSQIIRLPAPPSLLVDNTCRRAGTKQMGARGEAQGIQWYSGLHGQNSAWGKFRTSPRKMRGKFRTKLKYGIFPAEKYPGEIPPPPGRQEECTIPPDGVMVGGKHRSTAVIGGRGGGMAVRERQAQQRVIAGTLCENCGALAVP